MVEPNASRSMLSAPLESVRLKYSSMFRPVRRLTVMSGGVAEN